MGNNVEVAQLTDVRMSEGGIRPAMENQDLHFAQIKCKMSVQKNMKLNWICEWGLEERSGLEI